MKRRSLYIANPHGLMVKVRVPAEQFGDWTAHGLADFGDWWRITHVPSGRAIPDWFAGYPTKDEAIRAAQLLSEVASDYPKEPTDENTIGWQHLFEAVLAEVMS